MDIRDLVCGMLLSSFALISCASSVEGGRNPSSSPAEEEEGSAIRLGSLEYVVTRLQSEEARMRVLEEALANAQSVNGGSEYKVDLSRFPVAGSTEGVIEGSGEAVEKTFKVAGVTLMTGLVSVANERYELSLSQLEYELARARFASAREVLRRKASRHHGILRESVMILVDDIADARSRYEYAMAVLKEAQKKVSRNEKIVTLGEASTAFGVVSGAGLGGWQLLGGKSSKAAYKVAGIIVLTGALTLAGGNRSLKFSNAELEQAPKKMFQARGRLMEMRIELEKLEKSLAK